MYFFAGKWRGGRVKHRQNTIIMKQIIVVLNFERKDWLKVFRKVQENAHNAVSQLDVAPGWTRSSNLTTFVELLPFYFFCSKHVRRIYGFNTKYLFIQYVRCNITVQLNSSLNGLESVALLHKITDRFTCPVES